MNTSPQTQSREQEIKTLNLSYYEFPSIADEDRNVAPQQEHGSVEQSISEQPGRMARIRNKLGLVAAHANLAALDAQSSFASRLQASAEGTLPQHQRSQAREASRDTHETPKRSWLRRNIGKLATGLAVGAGVYLYSRGGIDFSGMDAATDSNSVEYTNLVNTKILTDGHGGGDSTRLQQNLSGFGQQGAYEIPIRYPAQIAPLDAMSWDDSNAIASDAIYDAVKANGGDYTHAIGYSQGSGGTLDAAVRIANENGGVLPDNVDVSLIGSPSTPGSGAFRDDIAKIGEPLFNSFGIDVNPEEAPAGTVYYGKPGDFWANSGGRNLAAQAGQLAATFTSDTHAYSVEDLTNPANIITMDGGRKVVHVTDDLSSYGHIARTNNLAWSEPAERLADAVAPEGIVGQAAPEVNMQEAASALHDVIEETASFHGVPIDLPDFTLPAPVEQWTPPAQEWVAPVQEWTAPVEQWVAPVQEAVTNFAPTPAVAEQVQQIFAQPELQQAVNDFTTQLENSPLGQLIPR